MKKARRTRNRAVYIAEAETGPAADQFDDVTGRKVAGRVETTSYMILSR